MGASLRRPSLLAVAFALSLSGTATAQDAPLSAIDWLSQSFDAPQPLPPREPPVAQSGQVPDITVQRLGAPSPDPIGLLPPEVTGLPRSLWAQSAESDLLILLQNLTTPSLPALQELLMQLLLAEARPPLDAAPEGPLFLARADKLLDIGALDQAQALIEAADLNQPQIFTRWFDISLLTGTEDFACEKMAQMPALAPAVATRVFCLARSGDWAAAALIMNTSRALGRLNAETERLLTLFLDPELAEEAATFNGESLLPPAERMSPLIFRLYEAIGEPVPTSSLPRAFAHADLRPFVAWRNRLESAERLARAGALSENILIDAYTSHTPAASGGIWARARALQRFDTALSEAKPVETSQSLPMAWTSVTEARVEVPFARFYAPALALMPIEGPAGRIAFAAQLLSGDYERASAKRISPAFGEAFLIAVAQGTLTSDTPLTGWEDSPHAAPIRAAFTRAPAEGRLAESLNAGKVGEALLKTITLIEQGKSGDSKALEDGLLALRQLGLTDFARRSALELLLLERPL